MTGTVVHPSVSPHVPLSVALFRTKNSKRRLVHLFPGISAGGKEQRTERLATHLFQSFPGISAGEVGFHQDHHLT
jgi:hypothetical protein